MEKKVSIIVPVYNVSQYISKCLDSLINQTYTNLEIILIDDDSTDNSLEICKKYEKLDSRVFVFHKTNGGAASARNVGLDNCHGDYITFVDSDDYVESNYVEKLLFILEKHNADISVCSFFYEYTNSKKINNYDSDIIEYDDIGFIKRFLDDWTCGLIWNKLFKSELLEGIRFKEGHKIDDEFFTYRLIMKSDKIVLFNLPLYHYVWRETSVMNNVNNKELLIMDRLSYLNERYLTISKKYPQLKQIYFENYIDNLLRLKTEATQTETLQYIKKVLKQNTLNILTSKMSILKKIIILKRIKERY